MLLASLAEAAATVASRSTPSPVAVVESATELNGTPACDAIAAAISPSVLGGYWASVPAASRLSETSGWLTTAVPGGKGGRLGLGGGGGGKSGGELGG